METQTERLLTYEELSDRTGIKCVTLAAMVSRRQIPFVRLGVRGLPDPPAGAGRVLVARYSDEATCKGCGERLLMRMGIYDDVSVTHVTVT